MISTKLKTMLLKHFEAYSKTPNGIAWREKMEKEAKEKPHKKQGIMELMIDCCLNILTSKMGLLRPHFCLMLHDDYWLPCIDEMHAEQEIPTAIIDEIEQAIWGTLERSEWLSPASFLNKYKRDIVDENLRQSLPYESLVADLLERIKNDGWNDRPIIRIPFFGVENGRENVASGCHRLAALKRGLDEGTLPDGMMVPAFDMCTHWSWLRAQLPGIAKYPRITNIDELQIQINVLCAACPHQRFERITGMPPLLGLGPI